MADKRVRMRGGSDMAEKEPEGIMGNRPVVLVISVWMVLLSGACGTGQKLRELRLSPVSADVAVAEDTERYSRPESPGPDTARVRIAEETNPSGDLKENRIIMDAVKDEETGEMVPTDRLQPVVVRAKFRNLAERGGKVDIGFDITVPETMLDSKWQVRLAPELYISQDTLFLEKLHITGERYRAGQLRGYELFNKYLSSIIPDSCDFVNSFTYRRLLEIFLERNFPALSRLGSDTSFADTSYARSLFGVTEEEAIRHYTKNWLVRRNERRKLNRDKMYGKYIKSPLVTEGIRLDSVVRTAEGSVRYHYVQTILARKDLRKAEMVLRGAVFEENRRVYTMPPTEPLTFYISSITALADNAPRYIKRIIERNARENTAAYIDFETGRYDINDTLSDNEDEIGRIKENIRAVLCNEDFFLDSLIITAACSPEGDYRFNAVLAQKRAGTIKRYFSEFISGVRDSLRTEVRQMSLSGEEILLPEEKTPRFPESDMKSLKTDDTPDVSDVIKIRSVAEEWERLEKLVRIDTALKDRTLLLECFSIQDPDNREKALSRTQDYPYLRKYIYPLLRTVKFDFHLHRRGMIKDTVHTTEIDTVYMSGLKALSERDYKTAVTKLRIYEDLNTAVAYICLDYNGSALEVLKNLPVSARRDYMLAVVYARIGEERKAADYFLSSTEQDPSMRHRGNLDPEISTLIKKYDLNNLTNN